jgi:hypothetical protein
VKSSDLASVCFEFLQHQCRRASIDSGLNGPSSALVLCKLITTALGIDLPEFLTSVEVHPSLQCWPGANAVLLSNDVYSWLSCALLTMHLSADTMDVLPVFEQALNKFARDPSFDEVALVYAQYLCLSTKTDPSSKCLFTLVCTGVE